MNGFAALFNQLRLKRGYKRTPGINGKLHRSPETSAMLIKAAEAKRDRRRQRNIELEARRG